MKALIYPKISRKYLNDHITDLTNRRSHLKDLTMRPKDVSCIRKQQSFILRLNGLSDSEIKKYLRILW